MRALFLGLSLRQLGAVCGAVVLASGCVAGNDANSLGAPPARDAGASPIQVVAPEGGSQDAGGGVEGGTFDNRCGMSDYCLNHGTPDDPLACAQYDAGGHVGPPYDSGRGAQDARGSKVLDAGAGDGSVIGSASRDASLLADAGDGSPRVLAQLPIPAPMPQPTYACQVGRDNSDGPVHQCVPSGSGAERSPCTEVSDCGPGLACVGPELAEATDGSLKDTGQCLHYCCAGAGACGSGTYCADRRLLDGTTRKPLIVPACAPGEACGLLEPYPCDGAGCSCPPSTSCTVVSGDGTKGCVKPGKGKVGESCPCAAGYYCSLAASVCVKMCKTDGIDDRCAPGRCQAAAGFPAGFGLCVGYTPAKQ
jgi:hypothetical protein